MNIQYPKLVITQDEPIKDIISQWVHQISSDLHPSILDKRFIPKDRHWNDHYNYRMVDEHPFNDDQYTGIWIDEGEHSYNIRLQRCYSNSSKLDEVLVEYLGFKGQDTLDNKSVELLNRFIKKMYIKNEKMKIEKVAEEAYGGELGHKFEHDNLSVDLGRNQKNQVIVNDNFIYQDEPCMVVKFNLIQDDKYILSSVYLVIKKDEQGNYDSLGVLYDITWLDYPANEREDTRPDATLIIPEDSIKNDSIRGALKKYALSADMLGYNFEFKTNSWSLGVLRPVKKPITGKLIDVMRLIKRGHWRMKIDHPNYNTIDFFILCCFHSDKVLVKCVWQAHKGDKEGNRIGELENFVHVEYPLVLRCSSENTFVFIDQLSKHVKDKAEQYITKMLNMI